MYASAYLAPLASASTPLPLPRVPPTHHYRHSSRACLSNCISRLYTHIPRSVAVRGCACRSVHQLKRGKEDRLGAVPRLRLAPHAGRQGTRRCIMRSMSRVMQFALDTCNGSGVVGCVFRRCCGRRSCAWGCRRCVSEILCAPVVRETRSRVDHNPNRLWHLTCTR